MTIASLIILLAIVFALAFERAGRKLGIAAVPTLPWQRDVMIGALKKYRPTNQLSNIAELGCGWGGLIASILRAYPTSTITGFEGFLPAVIISRLRFAFTRRAKIKHADFFQANLSEFDAIICYLSHAHMKKLQDKFRAELKPGAIIISNAFPMPDWTPIEHSTMKMGVTLNVYIYRKD